MCVSGYRGLGRRTPSAYKRASAEEIFPSAASPSQPTRPCPPSELPQAPLGHHCQPGPEEGPREGLRVPPRVP